jgi:hypothetical protein
MPFLHNCCPYNTTPVAEVPDSDRSSRFDQVCSILTSRRARSASVRACGGGVVFGLCAKSRGHFCRGSQRRRSNTDSRRDLDDCTTLWVYHNAAFPRKSRPPQWDDTRPGDVKVSNSRQEACLEVKTGRFGTSDMTPDMQSCMWPGGCRRNAMVTMSDG